MPWSWLSISFLEITTNNRQTSITHLPTTIEDGKVKDMTIQPTNGVYRIEGQYKEKQEVKDTGCFVIVGLNASVVKRLHNNRFTSDTTLAGIQDAATK